MSGAGSGFLLVTHFVDQQCIKPEHQSSSSACQEVKLKRWKVQPALPSFSNSHIGGCWNATCEIFFPTFKGPSEWVERWGPYCLYLWAIGKGGLLCHSGRYCCGWENLNLYDSPLWEGGAREGASKGFKKEKDEKRWESGGKERDLITASKFKAKASSFSLGPSCFRPAGETHKCSRNRRKCLHRARAWITFHFWTTFNEDTKQCD